MSGPGIEILVEQGQFSRWHERLRDRIAKTAPQSAVHFRFIAGGADWPSSVSTLLTLERMLLRRSRETLCDRIDAAGSAPSPTAADIIVDLTAEGAARADGARVLRPRYEGRLGEISAAALLLGKAQPEVTIEDVGQSAIVARGLPSLEAADGLTGGLEAIETRVITLIEQALFSKTQIAEPAAPAQPASVPAGAGAFLLRNLAHQAAREIYHLLCYSPHWRIGWRLHDGPGALETGNLSGAPWRVLADRDVHFSADPFPIEKDGRSFLFFESLDYRTDKGTIFAQETGESGPVGAPFLVLEEPWHLSYPFLIEDKGALYMIPEASNSGAVSIYRCVDFPRKWECAGRLIEGVEAADATVFRHDGRFWMTCVTRDGAGGYSDTLAIHYAQDLLGPWEEHALRPALVDSRFARPAGAVALHNGALLRPVQDCSQGYGKRTLVMRIDRLDPENFEQTQVGVLAPCHDWPGARLHTVNRWGRLECLDGAILAPKNMTLRGYMQGLIDKKGRAAQ